MRVILDPPAAFCGWGLRENRALNYDSAQIHVWPASCSYKAMLAALHEAYFALGDLDADYAIRAKGQRSSGTCEGGSVMGDLISAKLLAEDDGGDDYEQLHRLADLLTPGSKLTIAVGEFEIETTVVSSGRHRIARRWGPAG